VTLPIRGLRSHYAYTRNCYKEYSLLHLFKKFVISRKGTLLFDFTLQTYVEHFETLLQLNPSCTTISLLSSKSFNLYSINTGNFSWRFCCFKMPSYRRHCQDRYHKGTMQLYKEGFFWYLRLASTCALILDTCDCFNGLPRYESTYIRFESEKNP